MRAKHFGVDLVRNLRPLAQTRVGRALVDAPAPRA